jgi:hypothetical protein
MDMREIRKIVSGLTEGTGPWVSDVHPSGREDLSDLSDEERYVYSVYGTSARYFGWNTFDARKEFARLIVDVTGGNRKYLQWLCNCISGGNIKKDEVAECKPLLVEYDALYHTGELTSRDQDLYRCKDVTQLRELVARYNSEDKDPKEAKLEGMIKTVYDDGEWVIESASRLKPFEHMMRYVGSFFGLAKNCTGGNAPAFYVHKKVNRSSARQYLICAASNLIKMVVPAEPNKNNDNKSYNIDLPMFKIRTEIPFVIPYLKQSALHFGTYSMLSSEDYSALVHKTMKPFYSNDKMTIFQPSINDYLSVISKRFWPNGSAKVGYTKKDGLYLVENNDSGDLTYMLLVPGKQELIGLNMKAPNLYTWVEQHPELKTVFASDAKKYGIKAMLVDDDLDTLKAADVQVIKHNGVQISDTVWFSEFNGYTYNIIKDLPGLDHIYDPDLDDEEFSELHYGDGEKDIIGIMYDTESHGVGYIVVSPGYGCNLYDTNGGESDSSNASDSVFADSAKEVQSLLGEIEGLMKTFSSKKRIHDYSDRIDSFLRDKYGFQSGMAINYQPEEPDDDDY